ncbi:MAG: hypothetical protein ABFS46_03165 [Myxococcota bacterium]
MRGAIGRMGVVLLAGLLLSGCLMPSGSPVLVERRTGDYWSGEGVLLERSEDGEQCRVALRDTALVVQKKWVACRYVHVRHTRG